MLRNVTSAVLDLFFEHNSSHIYFCSADKESVIDTVEEANSSSSNLPDCWSANQRDKFLKANDWLTVNIGRLGCRVCSALAIHPACTITLSKGWVEGIIIRNGHSKEGRQSQGIIANAARHQFDETCKVFRTAYYVAKQDWPYTDHPDLVTLQQQNGVNMGRILHSETVCKDIIDHNACEQRRSLVTNLLLKKSNMSVTIDESTSLSRLSCLIVYVRAVFDIDVGPVTFFLDIVELGSTNSDGIVLALTDYLTANGFTEEFLRDHWIGLGTDGASVMLGIKSGVAAKLTISFPRLISWHCFNHRLELAVCDAVKSCMEINHFKAFIDSLYALYSMSPKCQRELAQCADELDVMLNKIGRILDVRWVSSSFRTVRAIWRSYEALHSHFRRKSIDSSVDSQEKAKFIGLAKKLESPAFIKNLGLMFDALQELADLSLALQQADVNLPSASRLVSRQVEIFTARKSSTCEYYDEACAAVKSGSFKGITVATPSPKQVEISKVQFYQALADSIAARLQPDTEKWLCQAIQSLEPTSFIPSSMFPEFGEADVKLLCTRFNLSFSEIKKRLPRFQRCPWKSGTSWYQSVKKFCEHTTCEHSRVRKRLQQDEHHMLQPKLKLTVHHMSSLIFVSLCGPPVTQWEPLKYVQS